MSRIAIKGLKNLPLVMLNLRGEGMDYPLKAYIYLFISIIVYNLVAWLIPKRMTKQEMYTTTIFALYFQAIVDVYLDLKYHLYWQWDWGIDYISMLMMLGIYCSQPSCVTL